MAARVSIAGRVQGVGFRAFTEAVARRHGACGWVRNMEDGRVEAHIEGEDAAIEAVLDELRQGPPLGRVDSLDRETVDDQGATDFEIRH